MIGTEQACSDLQILNLRIRDTQPDERIGRKLPAQQAEDLEKYWALNIMLLLVLFMLTAKYASARPLTLESP